MRANADFSVRNCRDNPLGSSIVKLSLSKTFENILLLYITYRKRIPDLTIGLRAELRSVQVPLIDSTINHVARSWVDRRGLILPSWISFAVASFSRRRAGRFRYCGRRFYYLPGEQSWKIARRPPPAARRRRGENFPSRGFSKRNSTRRAATRLDSTRPMRCDA